MIEMGLSHAGEIDRLARAARPDVSIITCIGVSHIGNLGSQENICKGKAGDLQRPAGGCTAGAEL